MSGWNWFSRVVEVLIRPKSSLSSLEIELHWRLDTKTPTSNKMSYESYSHRRSQHDFSIDDPSCVHGIPSRAHPMERWQIDFSIDLAASIAHTGMAGYPYLTPWGQKKMIWLVRWCTPSGQFEQGTGDLDSWPLQFTIHFFDQKQ